MAIKFLNFDYDESNPTDYQYTASDWRTVQMNVLSNGIVLNAGADIATDTSLKVTAITGGVNITNGIISIQGSQGIVTNTVAENVLIAIDGTYKIVMEFNTVLGGIYSKAITSSTALTRTATVWQLQIATVVKSGSTYTVTDTRTDTTLCGYANRLDNKDATRLQSKPISTTAPTAGQILQFDGTQYLPVSTTTINSTVGAGTYTKFNDGTMICRIKQIVADQAITSVYGSLFLGYRTWTFPAPFIDTVNLVVSPGEGKWGTGASWQTSASAVGASSCQLNFLDTISRAAGTNFIYSATAIGRWK